MSDSKERCILLAKRLLSEHAKKRSWRMIAKQDYPEIVKAGTLNRIAKSNGKWKPKNKKILTALGLCNPIQRKPDFIIQWDHLPRDERHQVIKQYLQWKGKL